MDEDDENDGLYCERRPDKNKLLVYNPDNSYRLYEDYTEYQTKKEKGIAEAFDKAKKDGTPRPDETDGWNHWEYMNCLDREIKLRSKRTRLTEEEQTVRNLNNQHIAANMRRIESIFNNVDERDDNIRYRKMDATRYGICKEIDGIDIKHVKIKIGVNLRTQKFVILRWGQWRDFDPINMIIKVEPERIGVDIEEGENPITKRAYPDGSRPSGYHAVLRGRLRLEEEYPAKSLYYSINTFTFYKGNDGNDNCQPVLKYRRGLEDLRQEDAISCGEIETEFKENSNISMYVINYIVGSRAQEFLGCFVREFGGITDEMRGYGGFFGFNNTFHNLMEEQILTTPAQLEILRTRYGLNDKYQT